MSKDEMDAAEVVGLNGRGWYMFTAYNTEAQYGWCETEALAQAAEDWLNRDREINPYYLVWLGNTDETEHAPGFKLMDFAGLLVNYDSSIEDFAIDPDGDGS